MKRVDLGVGVAAGLGVLVTLFMILTLPGTCDSPNQLTLGRAVAPLAVLASYMSVPLLFGLLRGRRVARFVWLWTPLLGSLFCAVALYTLVPRSKDWDLELSATVWLALCVWTLPFAAVVYYSRMIFRGMRRRHEGPKENLT